MNSQNMNGNAIRCFLHFIGIYCLLLVATGCGDTTKSVTTVVPPDQLFWALTINYPSVNLSTEAPYDTVQLVAMPRNVYGEILPNAPAASFAQPQDASVRVTTNGLVTGLSHQANSEGTKVVGTLTYNGVTRTTNTFVTVTELHGPPPTLAQLSIHLPPDDRYEVNTCGACIVQVARQLPLIATDINNQPIDRLNVQWTSSDTSILLVDQTGLVTGLRPGKASIVASANAYGVAMRDSIQLTATAPRDVVIWLLALDVSRTFAVTIPVGGEVFWVNNVTDTLDVVFDAPDAAEESPSLPSGVGNFRVASDFSARAFYHAGVYRWHSTKYPISGTITVK